MVDATLVSPSGELSPHLMIINDSSTIVANRELLCCELSEGAVILDTRSGVYYGLDPVGTFVWGLIQSPKTMSEVTTAVMNEYAVEPARCKQDLSNLFNEMAKRGLIEIKNA